MADLNQPSYPGIWSLLGAQAGGSFLSGLGGLLAGPTWQEKTAKRVAGGLERNLNTPLIQQSQLRGLYPQLMNQVTPQLNQLLARLSGSKGLGSGNAQGEATKVLSDRLSQILGNVQQKAFFANAQAPLQRTQLLSSLLR